MSKPVEMKSVNLVVLNKDIKVVTNLLYDLKLIEFIKVDRNNNLKNYESEDLSVLSNKILKLRSTITYLKPHFTSKTTNISSESPIEQIIKLEHERKEVEKKVLALKDELRRKKIIKNLKLSEKDLNNSKLTIGFVADKDSGNLKYLKNDSKLRKVKEGGRTYFVTSEKQIPFKYKEFFIPKNIETNLENSITVYEKKLTNILEKLNNLANGNLESLQKEELKLSKEIALIEAKKQFGKTEHVTFLSGFVPAKYTTKVDRKLAAELGDSYYLEIKDVDETKAPTLLENGPASSKFENLLRLYSLPKYGEFDPTFLMLLIFPLFYGFVLGDAGYGLVSLIIFTLAKVKFPNIRDFLTILQFTSISSIIWGVIYGEYFGFEPNFFAFEFHRSAYPETLLIIALIFGLIHLNMGLLIGFYNMMRKNIKQAIYDKLSWIVLQVGLIFVTLGILNSTQIFSFLGWSIFLISLVMLYLGHGFMGLIEIPSFFTNLLSYARLMAVGISSIAIAVLVNEFTMMFYELGPLWLIAAIFMFTLGHIFNIILGNFESFLQSLRLHYVEFFTKFYEGDGREFEPFGSRKLHDLQKE